jgi:hypothetical protein
MQRATHLELTYLRGITDVTMIMLLVQSVLISRIALITGYVVHILYMLVHIAKTPLENIKYQAQNSLEPVIIVFTCPNSVSQLVVNKFKPDKFT